MPTLLVASAGGHLQELRELLPRFSDIDRSDVTWVTYDTVQSRSLLAGEDHVFVPYANPRQPVMTLRHSILAGKILERRRYTHAISTGSSIAVGFLPRARLHGLSCHYVESATRVEGPSLTGRILARVPGIHLYSQAEGWPDPPWHHRGSVFDDYQLERDGPRRRRLRRVVVAVGSMRSYGFQRLIRRVIEILPAETEVLWQTGSTDVSGLDIASPPSLPSEELAHEMTKSDVVVTHAGVGLSLLALSSGHCPVVVPRRKLRGEHVDDHQVQVAAMLASSGLALTCEAEELSLELLEDAASRRVKRAVSPPSFELVPGR